MKKLTAIALILMLGLGSCAIGRSGAHSQRIPHNRSGYGYNRYSDVPAVEYFFRTAPQHSVRR